MDAGTDIGFPYFGDSPELGAFEQPLPIILSLEGSGNRTGIVHPNPAEDIIFVGKERIQQAWIADLAGRNYSISLNENSVDVSHLKNGIYIIWLVTQENKLISSKFSVIK